jgi:carbamoyltransferase
VKVLGVVAKTHDSGIALLDDGVPELIFEEERFNRTKKTKKFPKHSLTAATADFALRLADVDVITTPWNVRQLRKTAVQLLARNFPLSLSLLLPSTHESQQNQIMVLNSYLRRGLRKSFGSARLPPIVNVGHHDSHAAVFFVSPFEEALVLVMDGYGDDSSSSAYFGRGTRLDRRWSTEILNSVGLVYTFVTQHLGFAGFGDEGKVMALAAFGTSTYVDKFRDVIRSTPDGDYAVDMSYFSYDKFGQLRPFTRKFIDAFGRARRPDEPLTDRHRDLAFALQTVTEEVILNRVRSLLREYPVRDLCMTGGVALNCVANAKVLEGTDIRRVWVPPCASDTGAPFGSALWHTHQTLGLPRRFELTHPYYGRAYKNEEIIRALETEGLRYHQLPTAQLLRRVAKDLADGKIVGWFQDRFEMGPRALGNRSILADPRRAEMRDELNDRVKKREPFRPFAPVVLAERASEYFEVTQADPFMTLAPRVRQEKQGVIAAAVHVDGTGRIQTIDRAANPRYYGLIEEFARLTGVPVLLNTSFNRKEPIVASPKDAVSCYLLSGMDVLVLGDFYTTDRKGPPREAHAGAAPAAEVAATPSAVPPLSRGWGNSGACGRGTAGR